MQVIVEDNGEPEVKDEKEEESGRAPDHPEFASSEDHGEGCSLEVRRDQAQPEGATVGLQQHDERMKTEEETHEKPAGDSPSSVPEGDESTDGLQDSSTKPETVESQEGPDTDTSSITQPGEQVQSQQLEAANIQQEITE